MDTILGHAEQTLVPVMGSNKYVLNATDDPLEEEFHLRWSPQGNPKFLLNSSQFSLGKRGLGYMRPRHSLLSTCWEGDLENRAEWMLLEAQRSLNMISALVASRKSTVEEWTWLVPAVLCFQQENNLGCGFVKEEQD
ncbi:hypothetical protein DUI87_14883 [Hirundo rustica rustica]|uniref:Uncharacterized protein n=1 Tax=Hirundo rustica rustica TaxID=333673 RepID=A0A3M0K666_HIRRU|nr:hypothetical protein DUI87_14883 [Hirundo rustica rustica]